MLTDPPGFPYPAAITAHEAVSAFWSALGRDDDAAAAALFYEPSRMRNGMTPEGLAEQLRQRMGRSVAECRGMGVSTTVRVLADGRWAFLSLQTAGRPVVFDEMTNVHAAILWIVIDAGGAGWQLWGAPDPKDLEGLTLVQLPIVPRWGDYAP